jgi:dGTPase
VSLDGYGPEDVVRIGREGEDDDRRPPFARDYDRLIYSPAFRRLQGKTQVVSPGEADFFRTRLTHTLEVAQVARRLAEDLNRRADDARRRAKRDPGWIPTADQWWELDPAEHKVDPDLCEAAAILHDLGHPPFGHAGEEALHHAITRLTGACDVDQEVPRWPDTTPSGFNGNAQSFRLAVATLEHKHGSPGLQLTRATLDASLKYPWEYASPASDKSRRSWNVDPPQQQSFLHEVRADVPEHLKHTRTVEAEIMDWADDIAYCVHDLDDWLRAGYMPISELVNDDDARERYAIWVAERWKITDADGLERIHKEVNHLFGFRAGPFIGFHKHAPGGIEAVDSASSEASHAIRVARGALFGEFMYKAELVRRNEAGPEAPRRYMLRLHVPDTVRLRNKLLGQLLWRYVVLDHRMATQQHGQQHVAARLFEAYAQAAIAGSRERLALFPDHTRRRLYAASSANEQLRIVVDYVSSMTDAYAVSRYERLFGATARLHEFA